MAKATSFMQTTRPTVYILYHFFYPDNVAGAEHKKELAQGLVARGWEVTVLTSNRFCHDQKKEIYCLDEQWDHMRIIRVPRKQYNQSSTIGRLRGATSLMVAPVHCPRRGPGRAVAPGACDGWW